MKNLYLTSKNILKSKPKNHKNLTIILITYLFQHNSNLLSGNFQKKNANHPLHPPPSITLPHPSYLFILLIFQSHAPYKSFIVPSNLKFSTLILYKKILHFPHPV